jgi:hypothetical protein
MLNKIKIFILAIVVTGCSDGVSEKQKLAAIEQNNIWNAHSAEKFDWTQCYATALHRS